MSGYSSESCRHNGGLVTVPSFLPEPLIDFVMYLNYTVVYGDTGNPLERRKRSVTAV
jgi:hypothetical protein